VTLGRIVAENLRALRLGQKLSQETVAKKSGLSLSYISMLERGARTPPLDTLEALAKALAVPAVDLLRGGGPVGRKVRGRQ
jgi:transcriptional regulator with XRE-family HTH domain